MFIEVLHDALRFLVRGLVSFVIVPRFVRHDLDTRLNQAIQALLKRGVHVGDCRCEPFGVETETVYRYRCLLVGKNDRPTREAVSWLLKAFANDRANRGMNLFVDCNSME